MKPTLTLKGKRMFDPRKLVIGAILIGVVASPLRGDISIESVAFHKSTFNSAIAETGAMDTGGTVFIFVRNDGVTSETITNITFNGVARRVFPEVIMPGGIVTVTANPPSFG